MTFLVLRELERLLAMPPVYDFARYEVDGPVVTEPTGLEVSLAHEGFVWLEVETRGRAAHGSDPESGVDANLRMGRVVAGTAARSCGTAP